MSLSHESPHAGPRRCRTCVLYEGMRFALLGQQLPPDLVQGFAIHEDGECSLCRAYRVDEAGLAEELEAFVAAHRAQPAPVLVALSGGKDSVAALSLVVEGLGLDAAALLLDNGFIPTSVVDEASRLCRRLSTPLRVARLPPALAAELPALVEGFGPGRRLPCSTCSSGIFQALRQAADELGSHHVALGTNYHAAWRDGPRATSRLRSRAGRPLGRIHLPFAARRRRADTLRDVERLGVTLYRGSGHSTNCRVPGLLAAAAPDLGHPVELEDMALEIMSGHLGRDEALGVLGLPGPSGA